VEVVLKLDTKPNNAFGFQLRNDNNRPTRAGMLDLLRDALNHNWVVVVDYNLDAGKTNGLVIRTAMTK